MGDYRPSDFTTNLYHTPKPSTADLTHQGGTEGNCKSNILKLTNEREHLQDKLLIVRVNKFGFNGLQLVEIFNSANKCSGQFEDYIRFLVQWKSESWQPESCFRSACLCLCPTHLFMIEPYLYQSILSCTC